jgi:hypothetical protein
LWQTTGKAGPHKGHRLAADDRYQVWCITCAEKQGKVFLSNHEADIAWLDSFVDAVAGKRLTFARLTA